jgi:hypothetical protein
LEPEQENTEQEERRPQHRRDVPDFDELCRAKAEKARADVAGEGDDDVARAADRPDIGAAGGISVQHDAVEFAEYPRRRVRTFVRHHGEMPSDPPARVQCDHAECHQADTRTCQAGQRDQRRCHTGSVSRFAATVQM